MFQKTNHRDERIVQNVRSRLWDVYMLSNLTRTRESRRSGFGQRLANARHRPRIIIPLATVRMANARHRPRVLIPLVTVRRAVEPFFTFLPDSVVIVFYKKPQDQ